MENLKIKCETAEHSKQAQELFFSLGYGFEGCKNKNIQVFEYVSDFYLFAYSDGDLTHSCDYGLFMNKAHKEITLQELRDMVNPMKEYLEKQADGSYKLVMRGIVGKDDDIEVPEGAEIAIKFKNDSYGYGVIFYKNNGESAFSEKRKNWENDSKWTMRELLDENYFDGSIDLSHHILWQRHTQPEELPFMDSLNDQYAEIEQVRQSGMKFDSNKPRHSLLPKGAVNSVIEVLEFGAKKYSADNWQEVDNAKERYYNAAMRHIDLWWNGEKLDPETNVHHLAHAATNLFFLMWFDNK